MAQPQPQNTDYFSSPVDKPNVIIPLVPSYNTRGIDAEDNVFTDLIDQRKINCIYEVAQNSVSGKDTVYLVKRPGVADEGSSWGTSTQTAYLLEIAPGALAISDANHWVVSKSSDDIRVSDTSTTTVVDSTAGYAPAYIDKTLVGGSDTAVLQLRNASGTSKVYYSTTIGTWTQISDSDFTSLVLKGKMEFLHGYAFALTSTNRIYNSDLNSLSAWDSTNYIIKHIQQDIPTAMARLNNLVLAFGMSTLEVFHDVGNATGSPLESLAERAITGTGVGAVDGTGQRHYYSVHNNILYFIGNSPTGLYAYNGERIEKVSSTAVDKILASGNWYHVSTIQFSGKIGICIALDTVSATTQDALIFFPEWKDWFQWQSTVFQPVTASRLGKTFLGLGGSSTGEKLYTISEATDNWQDAGTNYTETVQFKIPTGGNHWQRMRMAGVIGDTARAASSLSVSFSDDDGQTWKTARTIDMTGVTKRLMNCGAFRERQVRLTHTGNEENRLESFIARIE